MLIRTIQWSRHAGCAALLAALLGAATLLAGCGGGGDTAAETTSTYSEGPIEGFGSVIVGGVRYDDSTAVVEDEDGNVQAKSELRLGTMVEVDASDVRGALARAHRIRFLADIVGPVNSVDAGASTLVVLGQPVDVTDHTVFSEDLPSGLAGFTAGSVVAVHAHFDAQSGHYVATRLDARPNAPVYRLRGRVSQLDVNAKTFQMGGEVINYANIAAQDLPSNLADGLRVRVRLQTTQVNGQWVAISVRHGVRRLDDRAFVHLHGIVSAFTSSTQFAVNGINVDATNATFPDGTAGLAVGVRVHVDGRIENGTIIARRVELHDHFNHHAFRFELHGAIGELDSSAKTFKLRGLTINYGPAVAYVGGTAGDLANGKTVEVKGLLSVDRRKLFAVIIKFEN